MVSVLQIWLGNWWWKVSKMGHILNISTTWNFKFAKLRLLWIQICRSLWNSPNCKYLGAFVLTFHVFLFSFQDPFASIWTTDIGTNLSLGFIIFAGLSAGIYFMYLCVLIYKVFRTISAKQAAISAMSRVRRIHYEG